MAGPACDAPGTEHLGRDEAPGDSEADPEGLLRHPSTRDGHDVARPKGPKIAFQVATRRDERSNRLIDSLLDAVSPLCHEAAQGQ